MIDFIKKLIPLVNLLSKFFVDVFLLLLDVPKSLVVSPGFHISVSFCKDFLELDIDRANVETLTHHVEQTLVSLVFTVILANAETF